MTVTELLARIIKFIVNPLIAVLFATALILFLWGVFQFIRQADSAEAREIGGRHIAWGLLGMAIMASAFGIIRVIMGTLGISTGVLPFPLP